MAVLLLILATAFFVAVEFALVAIDRDRVKADAREGSRRARATARSLDQLSFHLSGAQLGITLTSLVIGFIAEPTVAEAIKPAVASVVGEDRADGTSTVLALLLATLVAMVVGELVPKAIAIARPRSTAYALAPAMLMISRVAGPLIRLLNGAANATVRRFGIEPKEELTSVRSLAEIELLIRSSGEEGTLEPEALTLLTRTIRFGEKDAARALIPRGDVATISGDATLADLAALAVETGHSRFPVVGEDLDDVEGVVHVKDVYGVPFEARARTAVAAVMAPPFVVPETRDLADLLADLRRQGIHLAVVVDEHGGTSGIITLEDVLEEIVGEIDDEHDVGRPRLTRLTRPGEWVLEGSLHPDEVFDTCGLRIPEGDYETLAGFVLERLGHIPAVGEQVEHDGWLLAVEAMDRHRIDAVRARNRTAPGAAR